MDPEIKAIRKALQSRQNELRELIDQMKADQLNRSTVYRSLENELHQIKEKLEKPTNEKR